MIKVNAEGKEIKFTTTDGFAIRCFGNGDVYEDVNNYYCIPNFYSMDATGGVPKNRVCNGGDWIILIGVDKAAKE